MGKISSIVSRCAALCLVVLFIGTYFKTQSVATPETPPSKSATTLKANIDTLTISISLRPFTTQQKDPGGGLRSVLLHTPSKNWARCIEPHSRWEDGTPVSGDAQLTKQQMIAIVDGLEHLQLSKNAELFYSVYRQNPKSKPPVGADIQVYHAKTSTVPSCVIRANYIDGDYHTYVISSTPYGVQTIKLLNALKLHVPGTTIDQLITTYNRFPVEKK